MKSLFCGFVVRAPYICEDGTPSGHDATYLETVGGYRLRIHRVYANPFNDPKLIELVGQYVVLMGESNSNTLMISKLPSKLKKVTMKEIPKFAFALASEHATDDFLPARANPTDTGYDVKACIRSKDGLPAVMQIPAGAFATIPLGIKAFIPAGYWLQLNSRSSCFTKKNLVCLVGTIDETYEGEMKFAVANMNKHAVSIEHGERIGQLVPYRREEINVELVSEEEFKQLSEGRENTRGTGGFGSTGK
jgi:deoxyuridine 5'-triphosphate nucleotidohydrolase